MNGYEALLRLYNGTHGQPVQEIDYPELPATRVERVAFWRTTFRDLGTGGVPRMSSRLAELAMGWACIRGVAGDLVCGLYAYLGNVDRPPTEVEFMLRSLQSTRLLLTPEARVALDGLRPVPTDIKPIQASVILWFVDEPEAFEPHEVASLTRALRGHDVYRTVWSVFGGLPTLTFWAYEQGDPSGAERLLREAHQAATRRRQRVSITEFLRIPESERPRAAEAFVRLGLTPNPGPRVRRRGWRKRRDAARQD